MPSAKNQPALPTKIDFSALLPPVRDQGQRGTCAAFAITALHEVGVAAGGTVSTLLSEEVLYWGAKQADRNVKPGTSFRSIHMALGKWGQSEAHWWLYDPKRNAADPGYQPPTEAIEPANCFKARLTTLGVNVEEIKKSIASGALVAVSVQMSKGWNASGNLPEPQPADMIPDYHAVLLTGYIDGSPAGNGLFRFRNSWGPVWGEQGYGWIPYSYVETYGRTPSTLNPL